MEEANTTLFSPTVNIIIQALDRNSTNDTKNGTDTDNSQLKMALDYILFIILIVVMLAMGSAITFAQVLSHIKKPIGICIGMSSQFIIMPLTGYSLLKIINQTGAYALSMLIISCCPGGVISNAFAYYAEGDLSLSVAMTTFSTLFAMGMMPLNLWIYGRSFESKSLVVPYGSIALSLVFVTSPVLVGMGIRYWRPRIAEIITKSGSFTGALLILLTPAIEFLLYPEMFTALQAKLYCIILLMPFVGLSFGFLVASLFRQRMPVRRTISIESGIQNVPTAFAVISLSFEEEVQKNLLIMPFLYGFGMIASCTLLCIIYRVHKCYRVKKSQSMELKDLPTDSEMT